MLKSFLIDHRIKWLESLDILDVNNTTQNNNSNIKGIFHNIVEGFGFSFSNKASNHFMSKNNDKILAGNVGEHFEGLKEKLSLETELIPFDGFDWKKLTIEKNEDIQTSFFDKFHSSSDEGKVLFNCIDNNYVTSPTGTENFIITLFDDVLSVFSLLYNQEKLAIYIILTKNNDVLIAYENSNSDYPFVFVQPGWGRFNKYRVLEGKRKNSDGFYVFENMITIYECDRQHVKNKGKEWFTISDVNSVQQISNTSLKNTVISVMDLRPVYKMNISKKIIDKNNESYTSDILFDIVEDNFTLSANFYSDNNTSYIFTDFLVDSGTIHFIYKTSEGDEIDKTSLKNNNAKVDAVSISVDAINEWGKIPAIIMQEMYDLYNLIKSFKSLTQLISTLDPTENSEYDWDYIEFTGWTIKNIIANKGVKNE